MYTAAASLEDISVEYEQVWNVCDVTTTFSLSKHVSSAEYSFRQLIYVNWAECTLAINMYRTEKDDDLILDEIGSILDKETTEDKDK